MHSPREDFVSLWLSKDERIAVKGGSEDPREDDEADDDNVPWGDDIASFGTEGLPKIHVLQCLEDRNLRHENFGDQILNRC